ncbi:uncharacterized protein LOC124167887 [Ischnura elegans]|uniref:uncharacterized protein LOC124167887 n=1 Tax=Ischnura elegans TaxID=197161 RepID=UPI001ED8830C|nr:uncharacterized protein LOC124167887 [Ischnura elegans]
MNDAWDHVSRDGFIKAIQKLNGDARDVDISGPLEVTWISPESQGVTSTALRVRVPYRVAGEGEDCRTATFFAKCPPKYTIQLDLIRDSKLFYLEWLFFEKIVPSMLEAASGRIQPPFPSCYHIDFDGEKGTFYMEDIQESGYRPADPSFCLNGYDYTHCSIVVRRIGRFHALGMVAERRSSASWTQLYPVLTKDYIFYAPGPGDPPTAIGGMIENFPENTKWFASGIEGLPKVAVSSGALDKVIHGFWTTFCRLRETPTQGWCVLSHGDLWENNIMFRYERGEDGIERPVDAKFYDMQMIKCCHPAVDLVYFVHQSTGPRFRQKYLGDLVREYYTALSETLQVLGSEPPPLSLEEFEAEVMEKYKPLGVIGKAFFAPVSMLRDDPVVSSGGENRTEQGLEDFFKSGNTALVRDRFGRDPKYREKIQEVVREFVEMALPNGLDSVDSSPLLISEQV